MYDVVLLNTVLLGEERWEGQHGCSQGDQEGIPPQNGYHGAARVYQPHAYLCISLLGRFILFAFTFLINLFLGNNGIGSSAASRG